MTLGQKLAGYRKLSGLTQQQLGERLNISAQAISKWEKDLAEPALSTLRTLAELYKVSVDVLLDPDAPLGVPVIDETENEGNDAAATESDAEVAPQDDAPVPPSTIGFCKHCGIVVNQENVGTTQPTVLCKQCRHICSLFATNFKKYHSVPGQELICFLNYLFIKSI